MKKTKDKTEEKTSKTMANKKANKEAFLREYETNKAAVFVSCKNAGIVYATYNIYRRDDKEFDERCNEIEQAQIEHVESKLNEQIDKGNLGAIIFFLTNRNKERWTNTQKAEMKLSGELDISVNKADKCAANYEASVKKLKEEVKRASDKGTANKQ